MHSPVAKIDLVLFVVEDFVCTFLDAIVLEPLSVVLHGLLERLHPPLLVAIFIVEHRTDLFDKKVICSATLAIASIDVVGELLHTLGCVVVALHLGFQ